MATEVVDKIINIDVRYTDAIKAMGELSANLTRNKEELQSLKQLYKEGELSLKEYSQQQGVLTAENKILTQQLRVYQKEVENNVKIEKAHEGSLDSLRAEYAKNTAAISAMSRAEREAAEGQALIKHSADLKREINGVEQSLMDFRGNVGNYRSGFDGLGISIAQITREAPAFANSLTTGFMAISNNIPIMVDEIDRLRKANKALNEEGIKTPSVMSSIVKGLFSWQTLLSVGVTLLTIYGAKIVDWAGSLFSATSAVDSLTEAQNRLHDAQVQAVVDAQDEITRLRLLAATAGDASKSTDERMLAVKELQRLYPSELKALSDQNTLLLSQTTIYEDLIKQIKERAQMEAVETELVGVERKKAQLESLKGFQDLANAEQDIIEKSYQGMLINENVRKSIDYQVMERNKQVGKSLKDTNEELYDEYIKSGLSLSEFYSTLVTQSQDLSDQLLENYTKTIAAIDETESGSGAGSAMAEYVDRYAESLEKLNALTYEMADKTAYVEKAELERRTQNEISEIQSRLDTESQMTEAERGVLNDTILSLQIKLANDLLEVDKKYAKESLEAQIAERVAAMERSDMQTRLTMGREGATDEEIDLALGQQRVSALQSTFAQLKSLTDSEQDALYDSKQAYNDAVIAADLALYEAEKDLTQQTKEESDARRQIRQAELAATASVFGSLGAIVGAFGEENRAALILSKTLAIAEIAIQQGIAIAQVTRAAAGSSFSVYDFAAQLALGIASVTSAIASAVSAVNSADIGGGDSASVTFTPATSGLTSTTPTGWSSTLSSMNVASGQSAIDTANIPNSMGSYAEMEAMMTRAFEAMPAPIVTVKDYETEKKKVQIADNVARLN